MTRLDWLAAATAEAPVAVSTPHFGAARELAEIAEKLGVFFWPAVALLALLVFRSPVLRALDRIADAGGTIEVFGVKIGVGKATEQQQGLIEDVQKQLKLLSDRIDALHGVNAGAAPGPVDTVEAPALRQAAAPDTKRAQPRVLWVDDYPENNSLIVASLKNRGFDIATALSSDEGLAALRRGHFDAVISDMGRRSDDDGVTFTRAVRGVDPAIPILIFCSARAAARYGQQARDAGATIVTDSATVIGQSLLALQAA